MALLIVGAIMEEERRRGIRQQRIFRDRLHPLDAYNDVELYQRYRLDREAILSLVDVIHEELQPRAMRNHALLPIEKLFIALRFYATGSFQRMVGDTVSVSQSTTCRAVSDVSEALLRLMPRIIKFPANEDIHNIIGDFYEIAGFPAVMAVIDGTHIWITSPSDHEERYINRKNYHSINTQVVMDSKCRFINVVASWPGSTHDSVILRESGLTRLMETRRGHEYILGDSGYPLKTWLMTPYLQPNNAQQRAYNISHKSTRNVVERGIGQWKRRFHCLHGELRYSPAKSCNIIGACAILHNIAKDRGLPDFEEDDVNGQPEPVAVDDVEVEHEVRAAGAAARNLLANNHFR